MSDPAAQHPRPPGARPPGARGPRRHPKWAAARRVLRLIFSPVAIILAILYFLVDGIVLSLLRPLLRRLSAWPPLARLAVRISRLGPYPTLALVLVPVVVLEPLKPAAFYLMAKRHVAVGTLILVATEIVKIVTVERLFRMSLPKLMSIPPFARAYTFVAGWLSYLQSLPAWQFVLRRAAAIKALSRYLWALVRG